MYLQLKRHHFRSWNQHSQRLPSLDFVRFFHHPSWGTWKESIYVPVTTFRFSDSQISQSQIFRFRQSPSRFSDFDSDFPKLSMRRRRRCPGSFHLLAADGTEITDLVFRPISGELLKIFMGDLLMISWKSTWFPGFFHGDIHGYPDCEGKFLEILVV